MEECDLMEGGYMHLKEIVMDLERIDGEEARMVS